ncbi:MAG: sensor histidine kinase [Thiohalomonadaceae bacterium]
MARTLAPARVLVIGGVLGLACVAFLVSACLRVPWFGLTLAADTQGRVVVASADGPAHGLVRPGDRLAVLEIEHKRIVPDSLTLLEQPNSLKRYADYHAFLEQQSTLAKALIAGELTLWFEDGRGAYIRAERRPLSSVPMLFWFQLFCGLTAFSLGLTVFAARQDRASGIFFMSGIGVLVFTGASALYTTRELALEPAWMEWLLSANYLGSYVFGVSLPALLWNYPKPLGRGRFTFAWYALAVVVWGMHALELTPGPLWAFNIGAVPIFAAILVFATRQWRATRGNSVSRATLNWMLRPMLLCCSAYLLLYMVPVTLGQTPVMSEALSYGLKLLMYIGFAIGITRYRLFESERWWLELLLWGGGGVVVLLLDALFLLWLNEGGALAMALAVAGWIYFPLRQWLWMRIDPAVRKTVEHYLPSLIEALFAARTTQELDANWRDLLARIYRPLDMTSGVAPAQGVTVAEDGLVLRIPALEADGAALELRGSDKGTRLFDSADRRLAEGLLQLTRQAAGARAAQDQVMRMEQQHAREREMMVRDLHDGLGGLTTSITLLADMARQNPSPPETQQALQHIASLSREALAELRGFMQSMEDRDASWQTLSADLRHWGRNFLAPHGIQLAFDARVEAQSPPPQSTLVFNLFRIYREALSNVVKHARAERVTVALQVDPSELTLAVSDEGRLPVAAGPGDGMFSEGRGLVNMRRRVGELGGELTLTSSPRLRLTLTIPHAPPQRMSAAGKAVAA